MIRRAAFAGAVDSGGKFGEPLIRPDLPKPTAQQGDDFLELSSSRRKTVCLRASCSSAFLISS
jgi:hypothetical protein